MSCQVCNEEPIVTFVRVGNGNVEIKGCLPHLKQLLKQNQAGMDFLNLKTPTSKELE